ncbi:hypothetical protein DAI22_04g013866 [Oryza sativa Japonica Group]|nr:hypothetical protein DAI22_04g013866 [Oryza sativa Japonica Group]
MKEAASPWRSLLGDGGGVGSALGGAGSGVGEAGSGIPYLTDVPTGPQLGELPDEVVAAAAGSRPSSAAGSRHPDAWDADARPHLVGARRHLAARRLGRLRSEEGRKREGRKKKGERGWWRKKKGERKKKGGGRKKDKTGRGFGARRRL